MLVACKDKVHEAGSAYSIYLIARSGLEPSHPAAGKAYDEARRGGASRDRP